VLTALAGFFLLGHFMAPELADDPPIRPAALVPEATWTELQDFFDECLTAPVARRAWRGDHEAGLVVILGRLPDPGRYQVLACFEGPDMAQLMTSAGPARHLEDSPLLGVAPGEVVVTSCGTGGLDAPTRQRFQAEFQAKFLSVGKI